eukprot:m.100609 g.100609  ORF g.100609 m.100609 type:complete len:352 (-) comp15408_c0_seq3:115-1170(-)
MAVVASVHTHACVLVVLAALLCKAPRANGAPMTSSLNEARLEFTVRDMDSCLVALKDAPVKRLLPRPYWLHFPKCGTSFGLTLHNYGCVDRQSSTIRERKFRNDEAECVCGMRHRWDPTIAKIIDLQRYKYCSDEVRLSGGWFKNHIPPPRESYNEYKGQLVGLFRDPRKRLLSGYNHGKHSFGLPFYLKQSLRELPDLRAYVEFPPIASCMTKMILGYLCATVVSISAAELEEAKRRVREDFAFVGLQEYWNESVCLFHRMFGGTLLDNAFQNSRSHVGKVAPGQVISGNRAGNVTYVPDTWWRKIKPEDDPFDWAIYQEARKKFFQNMIQYGLAPTGVTLDDMIANDYS